jgi:hypothetical protein
MGPHGGARKQPHGDSAYNAARLLRMRSRLIPVLALLVPAPLAHAAKPVTIAQMEQILSSDRHLSDDRVFSQLAGLTLTERVTAERLAAWQAQFTGPHTQEMLLHLADESAFQPLPASDLSSDPPPDPSTQGKIFASALDYVSQTMRALPNLFAMRQTLHFQTSPDAVMEEANAMMNQALGTSTSQYAGVDRPLLFTGQFTAGVTYRNGKEVLTDQAAAPVNLGLTTCGEFGPILNIVLGDAQHSSVVWGYWQQHGDTRLAVFRYRVPAEKSNYLVEDHSVGVMRWRPAYHGEIVVDPGTGSIFRISIVSDPAMLFEPATAILVEYGPVVLSNRAWIVPLHGVALIRAPIRPSLRKGSATVTPVQTYLNDVAFTRYRLFRAEARILSAEESQQLRDAPQR